MTKLNKFSFGEKIKYFNKLEKEWSEMDFHKISSKDLNKFIEKLEAYAQSVGWNFWERELIQDKYDKLDKDVLRGAIEDLFWQLNHLV